MPKFKSHKVGDICTTPQICRDARLIILTSKLENHQIIKGYKQINYWDEIGVVEIWEIIKVTPDRNDVVLKFLGYKYEE